MTPLEGPNYSSENARVGARNEAKSHPAEPWSDLLMRARREITALDRTALAKGQIEDQLLESAVSKCSTEISFLNGVPASENKKLAIQALHDDPGACRTKESAVRFLRDLAPTLSLAAEEAFEDRRKEIEKARKKAAAMSTLARRLKAMASLKASKGLADAINFAEAATQATKAANQARASARQIDRNAPE
jgi:hypothetical protein